MKKKVRSPQGGYGFAEKQEYREAIWGIFAEKLDVSNAVVAFFPSKEGLEIPIALRLGFKEKNLIAIDDAPAVIATSKWRKEYPGIRFYGNKLSRATERMAEDGVVLDAINMDFCNNLSMDLLDEISSVFFAGVIRNTCLLAYTMMSGRESRAVNTLAELLYKQDTSGLFEDKRLSAVQRYLSVLNGKYSDVYLSARHEGQYKSGKLKMVYGVLEWASEEYVVKKMLQELRANIPWLANFSKVSHETQDFMYFLKCYRAEIFGTRLGRRKEAQYEEAGRRYVSWLREQTKILDEMLYKQGETRRKYGGKRSLILECCGKLPVFDKALHCLNTEFFNGYKKMMYVCPENLPHDVIIER